MIVVVGCLVVIGAVLGGFSMAGGHVGALIHPSEIVTIGGAALGALIVMSPKKVLVDLMRGLVQTLKGSPFNRKAYDELFRAMYEVAKTSRVHGILALEPHLNHPHESSIFQKYPTIAGRHHTTQFICELLRPVMEGTMTPEALAAVAEAELKTIENEHHASINVLSKTADGLPGFGIVAAVLGIVITMAHIDGPVEEIGHQVGAALVGTFLGILLSYGFFAPLAVKLEFQGEEELAYFRAIAKMAQGIAQGLSPKLCVEGACRGLSSELRLTPAEFEELFKSMDAA